MSTEQDIPVSQLPVVNLQELGDLCASTPYGAIVEVGVYKGGSAFVLAQAAFGRKLHLFDTFEGMPEASPGDRISIGAFADTSAEAVRAAIPKAILHVGMFPGTLPDDLTDIAFVHIDCDQYVTCRKAIELLWPRMVPSGIMAFDDWPFPGIQAAVRETGLTVRFTPSHMAYAVKQGE